MAQVDQPQDTKVAGKPKAAIGPPAFARVNIRRAFEAVCDQIREQVASGDLRPGDRLPAEKDLALQFGVSRNAVREALRSLEIAGLLRAQTGVNGGFFVQAGNSEGISQAMMDMVVLGQMPTGSLTEARVMLTTMILRLACERATEEDLDAIESEVVRVENILKTGGTPGRDREIGRFHILLARASHNEFFEIMIGALSEIIRSLLVRIDPVHRDDFVKVRRTVLKHLRARDADAAVRVMTRHLRLTHEFLEKAAGAQG